VGSTIRIAMGVAIPSCEGEELLSGRVDEGEK
jgi:hypothetical protein